MGETGFNGSGSSVEPFGPTVKSEQVVRDVVELLGTYTN